MGRPPCCDKSNVKRGLWTEEEDLKLIAYTKTHGIGNWTSVPKKAGLKRCGKSCRLRWTNYLRPNLKHESFTPEEEELIVTLHEAIGSRWSIIANQLPGRTDNDVKNHWNTKLSKRLFLDGIDPVTHRPISEILGSIGGLPKSMTPHYRAPPGARISCLNRDLKNVFLNSKPPPPLLDPTFFFDARNSAKPFGHAITTTATVACSSTEASSSSTAATAHQAEFNQDTMQLDWSDFLAEGAFLAHDQSDNGYTQSSIGASNSSAIGKDQVVVQEKVGQIGFSDTDHYGQCCGAIIEEEVSSMGLGSFIDALLDRDREMMPEFPEFLANPDHNLP